MPDKRYLINTMRRIKTIIGKMSFEPSYRLSVDLRPVKDTPSTPPLIITGLYRSGTTLVTSVFEKLGVDLGPEDHRFQGRGKLAALNPNGFQENFLVNDLGRYMLYRMGGSGAHFPELDRCNSFDLQSLNDADFAYYSTKVLRDDRISEKVRNQIFKHYGVSNLNQYFCDHFDTSCWGFKDVHSGIYLPIYLKMWPEAKVVCVFREPSSFLKSAGKLSSQISLDTWIDYYRRVLHVERGVHIHWVEYDSLLRKDERVLYGLASVIQGSAVQYETVTQIMNLINPALAHYRSDTLTDLGNASELFEELKQKSIQSVAESMSYGDKYLE